MRFDWVEIIEVRFDWINIIAVRFDWAQMINVCELAYKRVVGFKYTDGQPPSLVLSAICQSLILNTFISRS